MKYQTRTQYVEATQIPVNATAIIDDEHIPVNSGDWHVKHEDGREEIVSKEEFEKRYERSPQPVRAKEGIDKLVQDAWDKAQAHPIVDHKVRPGLFLYGRRATYSIQSGAENH